MKILDYVAILPGVASLVLGVLATVITFENPQTVRGKRMWLFVFIIITLIAIICTIVQQYQLNKKDRDEASKEAQRDKDFAALQGQIASLIIESQTTETNNDDRANQLIDVLQKMEGNILEQQNKGDQISLKDRALILSTQILKFSAERRNEPIYDHSVSWEERVKMSSEWSRKTMELYASEYLPQLVQIKSEFDRVNIRDDDFDRYYASPVNPLMIVDIGRRLGVLADKLP